MSVNPLTLLVITGLGSYSDLTIVDASEYCNRGEAISFWAVMSRAQAAGNVLLGYYILPSVVDQPIESTINPQVNSRASRTNTRQHWAGMAQLSKQQQGGTPLAES